MERFLLLFSLLSAQSCQLIISDTLLRNVFVTESQHAVDNPQSRKACKEKQPSIFHMIFVTSVCAPECPHHACFGWIVDLDQLPNYLWCHKLTMNVETDVQCQTVHSHDSTQWHSDTQLEEQEENHSSDWWGTLTSDWSDICFCLFSCVVVSWSFGASDEPDQLLWLDRHNVQQFQPPPSFIFVFTLRLLISLTLFIKVLNSCLVQALLSFLPSFSTPPSSLPAFVKIKWLNLT